MRSSVAASRRPARARSSWISLAVAWASGGGRRRSSLPDFSTQVCHLPARGSIWPVDVCAETVVGTPVSKEIHVKNTHSFIAFLCMFFLLVIRPYDLLLGFACYCLVTGCRFGID